ncbi:CBO0543 family protein [Oceanobacillus sp. FSL K6-2867]|uniref:CBO0543 family protein n=1 Tax=Oceanobacillus sp. FSL K6-2867 TaxID=2954748 RepID=UPI0030D8764A
MTFKDGIEQIERANEQLIDADGLMSETVINAFLFTWQWWLGIGLFIIPWIVWFLLRKKESTGRLLMGGFITIILSLMIDLIALSRGLWSYPMIFSPIGPVLFLPYHFSLVPVAVMFTLQIKPTANPILKGFIFGALSAFVGMKFFQMIDFYNPKGWSSFYDLLIYLFLFLAANWFSSMDSFKKLS